MSETESKSDFLEQILKLLDCLNTDGFAFGILEVRIKKEERWESPYTANQKIRFETFPDILRFIENQNKEEHNPRIFSIKIVYKDSSYVYFDILCSRVSVFNSIDKFNLYVLSARDLIGAGKMIEIFEIKF